MKIKHIAYFLTLVLYVMPLYSSAAQLTMLMPNTVGVGDEFVVPVLFDTEGEDANAVGATLSYPKDLLALTEIRSGNSIIALWVDAPRDTGGAVEFSGIIPGGFTGSQRLVSLVFTVLKPGIARFSLSGGEALRNDGLGTRIPLSLNAQIVQLSPVGSGATVVSASHSDTTPPEPFTPVRESSEALFNGAPFAVFYTEDKQSGVDHYDVAEPSVIDVWLRNIQWHRAESPYQLTDQSGATFLYVRAVDEAGNARVEILSPTNKPLAYALPAALAILIVFIALLFLRRVFEKCFGKKRS